jgi:site-specific DNA-methyltransferase (adenine-specific)
MRTVWSINAPRSRRKHYASYPEELVTRIISAGAPEGGIVLDPFVGSGTTCIVAKKLGRRFVGIDINGEYVAMARKRAEAVNG